MRNHHVDLEEYASARLARLSAGLPPLVTGPRHGAEEEPVEVSAGAGLDDGPQDLGEAQPFEDDASVTGRGTSVVAFARGHVRAVAAVVVAGLVLCAVVMMRSRATSVPVTAEVTPHASVALPSTVTTTSPRASTSGTPSAASTLEVHVLGAVRRPGVVRLPAGARVQDAITAAGGLLPTASPSDLNLAGRLEDADQVVIGTRASPRGEVRHGLSGGESGTPSAGSTAVATSGTGSTTTSAAGSASSAGAATAASVDLNSATAEQLDQLPGVGPVTAQRILAFRDQHQRFSRVEELQEVDGIGPKTYAQIAPHVHV